MDGIVCKGFEERNRFLTKYAKTRQCDFMLRYHSIREAVGRDDAVWQPFQIEHLNDSAMFYSMNKSRQIGASFTVTAYAYADLMTKPFPDTVITTSINMEEAKEKIIYAKRWYEARVHDPENVPSRHEFDKHGNWIGDQGRRIRVFPELIQQSSFQLTWSNGARFISHPSKPPRGKKASVINDEFHHVQHAALIYTASVPMITRGRGDNWYRQLSTPAGAMGPFWEIHSNALGSDGKAQYPGYLRRDYGWWEIFDLCEKEKLLAARNAYKSGMPPEEMIRRYGTRMAFTLFQAVTIDDWEQEFCLRFLDSAYAFLTWELIRSCYPPYSLSGLDITEKGFDYIEDQDPDEVDKAIFDTYVYYKARTWEDALEVIRRLASDVASGKIEREMAAGYDCGRHRDNAEITIGGLAGGLIKQRALITLPRTEFDNQKLVLHSVMKDLPVRRLVMDKGGIGEDISEWAEKLLGLRVIPVDYSNESKAQWATNLKHSMERRILTLIPDRDQEHQLHSVQRKATQVGLIQYVVEEKMTVLSGGAKVAHHADKFWSLATMVTIALEIIGGLGGGMPLVSGQARTAETAGAKVAKKGFKTRGGRNNDVFSKLGRGR